MSDTVYSKAKEFVTAVKDLIPAESFIPLHPPVFNGKEKEYLIETVDSTFVSSVGPFVDKVETQLASLTGCKKAVAVVNGTAALHTALKLAGVMRETEVITQSLTFIATANAISYLGALPVFLDVDLDTMGLSPSSVRAFLEEFGEIREDGCYNKSTGRRISACVPMHTFGFMTRIEELIRVCREYNIPVVEDAAEALGSSYRGKPAGSFGEISALSFNGNKVVTAGGGGAILTTNDELGSKAKHITTTAKVPHRWEYRHDEIGFNYRMPNVNAALLSAQLESLDDILKHKKQLFSAYVSSFEAMGLKLNQPPAESEWNYWLMSVELNSFEERNAFLEYTNSNGVMTRPIWELMHRMPMFEHCYKDDQKNSEYLEARIVNIPSNARV
ncbi:LegC family aminotransferase [Phaeocystidibacter luteus]|uniref:LegC family aminotransferase n=1 Tax=Phaeocystidibacter luteus TaxID=911197 RepID=A0A6N6RL16_9FLAO|nr:LegC family aminotransferase [Phaeocystidibacter luteus]KAB2814317.1 LegC family aminotransferase [Phaeocystidibacter luteus]